MQRVVSIIMRRGREMMIGLLGLVAALALGTGAYLQHPKFGALPEGNPRDLAHLHILRMGR
jgi:hypothetical protein